MTASAHPSTPTTSMAHSTLREGVVAGTLGAAAVALWFLIVDMVTGRPLHTPAVLGALVSGASDPIVAAEGADRLKLAALYTPLHFIAFALFGVLVVFLVHRAQRRPSLLMLALLLFAAFEVAFTGFVAILEQTALGDLAWYQVAIGNLIAVVVMGWYVLHRHPGVHDMWTHSLDERE